MTEESARRSRTACPAPTRLAQYLARSSPAVERRAIEAHLVQCQDCRQLLVDAAELEAGADGGAHQPVLWPSEVRSFRVPLAVAAGLAAAAAIVLAVRVVPLWLEDARNDAAPAASPVVDVVGLAQLDAGDAGAVRDTLQTLRLGIPAEIAELRGTSPVLRGRGDSTLPRLLDPVATRVRTTRPQFSWQPAAGAEDAEYMVTIFDGRGQETASSDWMRDSQWTPSSDLPRDDVYTWQLGVRRGASTVYIPGVADPSVRFQVVSEEDAARMADVLGRTSAAPTVQGVLLVRAGLLAEAESLLARSEGGGPDADQRAQLLTALRRERADGAGR